MNPVKCNWTLERNWAVVWTIHIGREYFDMVTSRRQCTTETVYRKNRSAITYGRQIRRDHMQDAHVSTSLLRSRVARSSDCRMAAACGFCRRAARLQHVIQMLRCIASPSKRLAFSLCNGCDASAASRIIESFGECATQRVRV